MKKLFILYTLLFLLPLLQHNSGALHAQGSSGCYVSYKENLGLTEVVGLPELQAEACSLANVLPTTFQSQFKVYSVAYYLYTPLMGDGTPPALAQYVAEIAALSPYYLIIAKENTPNALVNKFSIVLKLPDTEGFSCLTENDRSFFQRQLEIEAKSEYSQRGNLPSNYPFAEKKVVEQLKKYITKSLDCCAGGNKLPCESCSPCPSLPSAFDLSNYFKNELKAIEIPIEIDNCEDPVNTQGLPNVQVLKELKIKFRSTDPFGLVGPMLDKVFKSDYFDDISPDQYYGFVTSNHAECTENTAFQVIKTTVKNVSSTQARLTANYEYLIWCHIWQNPAETNKGILFIHSSTPEWPNLAAASAPDVFSSLGYSFSVDNFDQACYQNKFEQSVGVIAATSLILTEKLSDNSNGKDADPKNNNTLLNEVGCNTSTTVQYYLTAAMQPVALPIGTITDFDISVEHALSNHRDVRALLFFTDAKGRWRSTYKEKGNSRYLNGFINRAHSLDFYDFGTSNNNNFEVWLNFVDPTQQNILLKQLAFSRSNSIPTDKYGAGDYVDIFYNIGNDALGSEVRSVVLPVHTLSELKKSYAEGAVDQRVGGYLFKVPKTPGSLIYDYYLLKYNKETEQNEWMVFNCGTGDWTVLPGDPFVVNDGNIMLFGYVLVQSPWLEHFLNTTPLTVHDGLDALGMVPVVGEAFDVLNGVIYFMEGEKTLAILSAASAIPIAGAGVKGLYKFISNSPVAGVSKVVDKGIHSVIVYKKRVCPNRPGDSNDPLNICYFVTHLHPTWLKNDSKIAKFQDDEFQEFIQEAIDVANQISNFEFADKVADFIVRDAANVRKGPDVFPAWLILKHSIKRTDVPSLDIWLDRIKLFDAKALKINHRLLPNGSSKVAGIYKRTGGGSNSSEEILGVFVNEKMLTIKNKDAEFYDPAKFGQWETVLELNGNTLYSRKTGTDAFESMIMRTPDKTAYSSGELDILKKIDPATGKPQYNQHCLERHGTDVTDEALRLRATEGIAPDGIKTVGESASKFNDPNDIKKGLQELGPNSTKFNNAVANVTPDQRTLSIEHDFPDPIGYGYPTSIGSDPSTLTSVPMKKIVATYNMQNGQWYLATMHPN